MAIDTAGNVDRSEYAGNTFDEINGQCIDLDGFHDGLVQQNGCANGRSAEAYLPGGSAIVMNNTHPDGIPRISRSVETRSRAAKFGGVFLMGSGNRVLDNVFVSLNFAHGDEPELASGIYLSRGLARLEERQAATWICGNRIFGYKMKTRCIAFGPGVSRQANTLESNTCSDEPAPR